MIARNVNIAELQTALIEVNKKYDNNVIFNRFEPRGRNASTIHFTLRVKDSKEAGHSLGFYVSETTGKRRRLTSACWHVHGDFFDALFRLNPKAVIKSRGNTITVDAGNWIDFNCGSIMNPLYASEKCDCGAGY